MVGSEEPGCHEVCLIKGETEMPGDTILYELKGNTGVITINRPECMNAINKEAAQSLIDVLARCKGDPNCRVVVVAAAGEKVFSSGADINVFIDEQKNTFGGREWSRLGQHTLNTFDTLGKPSIAIIDGLCAGGGCEIALACTFRIASDRARFALPEVSVGILPGWGGTQRLVQIIGKTKALELVLTGNVIDAGEAQRVERIVEPERVRNEYPLIERGIDRKGCERIIREHGLPVPMRSGCFICPFQRLSQWRHLRTVHPELYCKARQL